MPASKCQEGRGGPNVIPATDSEGLAICAPPPCPRRAHRGLMEWGMRPRRGDLPTGHIHHRRRKEARRLRFSSLLRRASATGETDGRRLAGVRDASEHVHTYIESGANLMGSPRRPRPHRRMAAALHRRRRLAGAPSMQALLALLGLGLLGTAGAVSSALTGPMKITWPTQHVSLV